MSERVRSGFALRLCDTGGTKLLFEDDPLIRNVFLWITALPCYAVLVCAWRVASNIGNNRSFSLENAKLFRIITVLAAGDTVCYLAGSILFSQKIPGLLALAFIVSFAGIVVIGAALAAAFSDVRNSEKRILG